MSDVQRPWPTLSFGPREFPLRAFPCGECCSSSTITSKTDSSYWNPFNLSLVMARQGNFTGGAPLLEQNDASTTACQKFSPHDTGYLLAGSKHYLLSHARGAASIYFSGSCSRYPSRIIWKASSGISVSRYKFIMGIIFLKISLIC